MSFELPTEAYETEQRVKPKRDPKPRTRTHKTNPKGQNCLPRPNPSLRPQTFGQGFCLGCAVILVPVAGVFYLLAAIGSLLR